MQRASIFISDLIRMHSNSFTVDGLGIASEPFIILPLDASDEELEKAIKECLVNTISNIPHKPWTKEETKAYYQKLGVKSQKALGPGVEVVLKDQTYRVIPVDRKGLFGEAVQTDEAGLLDVVKSMLTSPLLYKV